jgi:hypothetical protein
LGRLRGLDLEGIRERNHPLEDEGEVLTVNKDDTLGHGDNLVNDLRPVSDHGDEEPAGTRDFALNLAREREEVVHSRRVLAPPRLHEVVEAAELECPVNLLGPRPVRGTERDVVSGEQGGQQLLEVVSRRCLLPGVLTSSWKRVRSSVVFRAFSARACS